MTAASKNPADGAGQEAGHENLSVYNVNNKASLVKARIVRLRQTWHLQISDFQCFATFIARLFLEYAPIEVRVQFLGAPSETPHKTVALAETFLLLYTLAEDKATSAGAKYSLAEIWQAAIQLAGGA
ncbi:MAG TPA: hypothetical protein PK940_04595 [Rectinema sp.]|nr:hypothetical protein [Rectinema sp.]HRU77515.1 hypothetical protein [Rectinema sp.]